MAGRSQTMLARPVVEPSASGIKEFLSAIGGSFQKGPPFNSKRDHPTWKGASTEILADNPDADIREELGDK